MENKLAYLFLGLFLIFIVVIILFRRRDLIEKAVKLGLLGSALGVFSELFYFRDYWRPPSLVGSTTVSISIEDFIFGFGITALSFVVYPAFFGHKINGIKYSPRLRLYALFLIAGILGMLFFNIYLGVNSIFISSAALVIFTVIMIFLRNDLWQIALYSAVTLTAGVMLVYIVLFDLFAPHFWNTYWLLAHTRWNTTILGHVPLTEILWYFSWTLFASISYLFVSGKTL